MIHLQSPLINRLALLFFLCLTACGTSSEEYTSQAHAKLDAGQAAEAVSLLDQALKLNANNDAAYNARGAAYFSLKEFSQALNNFDKAIALNEKEYKYFYNRGNVKRALNHHQAALKDYEQAINLDSSHYEVFLNRALVQSTLPKAILDFDKAENLATQPDKNIYFYRGKTQLLLENFEAAQKDFEKCLGFDNQWATAYYYLALSIGGASGQANQAACEYLQKAQQLGETQAENALKTYCK